MVIKVGIVDDSSVVRTSLEKIIDRKEGLEVVGKSKDVYEARSMIMEQEPDVLTLDVEMPKMDGISFLERLMNHHPMPVVMVSSLTEKTSRKGMEALEKGAVDVIKKLGGDSANTIEALQDELITKLKAAYEARGNIVQDEKSTPKTDEKITLPESSYDVILIGSSTGGVQALRTIFEDLDEDLPPILIVQHMPPVFTSQFSQRLGQLAELSVSEAKDGDTISRGEALVAPGDRHMVVRRRGQSDRITVSLNEDEKVHSQRPSVDVLFKTAAKTLDHANILALVLTGMGKDGRDGANALEPKGATLLVQDEATSTVYGMPKQVKENVQTVIDVPLSDLAGVLNQSRP